MEGGYQLPQALKMLTDRSSPPVVWLQKQMAQGCDHGKALAEIMPSSYRTYFSVLVEVLPIAVSLMITKNIVDEQEKQRNETVTKLLYPILLLAGVCVGMLVFNTVVFPSMLNMAADFGTDMSFYIILQKTVSIVDVVFMGVCVLIALVCLFCLNPMMITSTYRFLVRRFPQNLLVQKASEEFAFFFVAIRRNEEESINILNILKSITGKPLVKHIAIRLDWVIKQMGENMVDAMKLADVEDLLLRYFTMGGQSAKLLPMMEQYLKMTKARNEMRIRRFAGCVQLVSYCAVGIVIVLVYQVLMLPMQMIAQL